VAIIYTISVTKGDKVIYSQNIVLDPSRASSGNLQTSASTSMGLMPTPPLASRDCTGRGRSMSPSRHV
jgi:hypothetical protein